MTDTIRIDLAREAGFRVGTLAVRPPLLEVEAGGVCAAIEPRVMQVLVVLAQAGGRVVSRDELAERCWQGRIVGEDALNRTIAKLRRVAASPGGDSFAIETVKKVGYRLVESPAATLAMPPPAETVRSAPPPVATAVPRRRKAAAVVAVTAAAAGLALWLTPRPAPAPPAAPPLGAANDLQTRGLSGLFEGTPERTAEGLAYLRQATRLAPRDAPVWGSLAMAYVLSLPFTPAADRAAVVARVREAATQAQGIDRREARSIAALASIEPIFGHWQRQDGILRDGLARAAPSAAPLILQRVQFLTYTGRTREALQLVEALSADAPLLPWIQAARVELLAANGKLDQAERVAARAGELWPRDRLTWFTRFHLLAYGGKPEAALAMAADARAWPTQTEAREVELAIAVARALAEPTPAGTDAVLQSLRHLAPTGQGHAEQAVRAAAALGRPRDAQGFAALLYADAIPPGPRGVTMPRVGLDGGRERNTAVLFLPPAAALRSEPGFAALVDRLGLTAYWRSLAASERCRAAPSAAPFCAEAVARSLAPRETPPG